MTNVFTIVNIKMNGLDSKVVFPPYLRGVSPVKMIKNKIIRNNNRKRPIYHFISVDAKSNVLRDIRKYTTRQSTVKNPMNPTMHKMNINCL